MKPDSYAQTGESSSGSTLLSRMGGIDALRGLAILGVIIHHVGYRFPSMGREWVKLTGAGRYGVDVFFAISGFVLYHAIERRWRESRRPRLTFLFQRWARLAPIYYLGIVFYGLLWRVPDMYQSISLDDGILNLTFLNAWCPSTANALVPGGWSISVEAAFAGFFVLIMPWLRNAARTFFVFWVTWGLAILVQPLMLALIATIFGERAVASGTEYFPLTHLSTFLVGVWCRQVWTSELGLFVTERPWLCGLFSLMGMGLLIFLALGLWTHSNRALMSGSAGALLIFAFGTGSLPDFVGAPLRKLGSLSYGLYLFHFAALEVAETLVVASAPAGVASAYLFTGTLVLTLVLSIPVAWLLYRWLECPVQAWVKRMVVTRPA